jgi:hypothetical protein
MGTRPEDYGTSGYYGALSAIYRSLQGYRGQPDFVRARTLRACDFFIPDSGFIVEFDETQHFGAKAGPVALPPGYETGV